LQQKTKLSKTWLVTLWSLLCIIIIAGTIRPYQAFPEFWNKRVIFFIYGIWLTGVLASGYLLTPIFKKYYKSHKDVEPFEKWLTAIYLGNVLIAGAFFMSFCGFSSGYYISGPIVFSFFLYLLTFGYFNNKWFENISNKRPEKYQNKKISSIEADKLLSNLSQLMVGDALYKKHQLRIKDVADKLDISLNQLSQLLNDNMGKSFKTYINEYRINAACELLATDHNLTLEGIGYEVGFQSKSTFFTTFKKIKLTTPSKYQQALNPEVS